MSTFIVGGVIICIAILIVRKMLHERKGKSCSGGCSSCKGCH